MFSSTGNQDKINDPSREINGGQRVGNFSAENQFLGEEPMGQENTQRTMFIVNKLSTPSGETEARRQGERIIRPTIDGWASVRPSMTYLINIYQFGILYATRSVKLIVISIHPSALPPLPLPRKAQHVGISKPCQLEVIVLVPVTGEDQEESCGVRILIIDLRKRRRTRRDREL